jgi:hypothetical protein
LQSVDEPVTLKLNDLVLPGFRVVEIISESRSSALAYLGLLHEAVAQDGAEPLAVVVEVFLQQWHDAVIPDEPQIAHSGIPVQTQEVYFRRSENAYNTCRSSFPFNCIRSAD